MSSQEKKKKRTTKKPSTILPPTLQSTAIPSLPDDLLLSCFARVSRLYYPTLSLVSKSFRSLLGSPELYQTRSLLARTESCLYVCLQFPLDPNPRWFTLCQKPTLTNDSRKKKKPSGYVLAKSPIPHSPPAHWSGLVAVGSNIYNIGVSTHNKVPSCSVSILDCWSHTWREAQSMRVERNYPSANVVDGKIYVAGGCKDCNSSNLMKVFDPKTQAWELVSSPSPEMCGCDIHKSAGIDVKVFINGENGVSYNPKHGRWDAVEYHMFRGWVWFCYRQIYTGEFKWCDSKVRLWRNLKGLEGLPKFASYARVKLADYGGKMAVLWDKFVPASGYKNKVIWCAVIALERRNNEEIWGKLEWLDAVLTVPKSYEFVHALAATV